MTSPRAAGSPAGQSCTRRRCALEDVRLGPALRRVTALEHRPALSNVCYELHLAAFRESPRTDRPGLMLLNLDRDGVRKQLEELLTLNGVAQLAGPERLSGYLDSLTRRSVSSIGVRSTNAATRGRATYRNFMGSGVDRGLRSVDTARSALGHIMFQIVRADGSANAGGAVEKSKVWLTR